MYQLYKKQQLNCNIETAWELFSSSHNLSKITSNDIGFTVTTNLDDETIFEGMEINYIVSTLLKILMKWKAIIINVEFQKKLLAFKLKKLINTGNTFMNL